MSVIDEPKSVRVSFRHLHWQFCLPCTMVQNREKHRINNHLIIHYPISLGVSEVSEQVNGRASGVVLQDGFLIILAHSAMASSTLKTDHTLY